MNSTSMRGTPAKILWLAAVAAAALASVSACQKAPPAAEPAQASADANGKDDAKEKEKGGADAAGVTLKSEEIERAGITTEAVVATEHAPEVPGYGVVLTREALAQGVADVSTAAAMERQSQAALARSRSLAGTPGAMPIETQESAARQAAVDHAALMLAERRLSAAYGRNAPWKDNVASPELAALASGESKLIRVTFPLGTLGAAVPAKLRLAHMGDAPGAKSLESNVIWSAPADASLPGRSFFALLRGSDVSEGERLIAWVAVGKSEPGVLIPLGAVVLSGGKYWCYIEEQPGTFVRTEVDASVPTDGGYFVKAGIEPGAKLVTASAGQLLAKELGTAAAD